MTGGEPQERGRFAKGVARPTKLKSQHVAANRTMKCDAAEPDVQAEQCNRADAHARRPGSADLGQARRQTGGQMLHFSI